MPQQRSGTAMANALGNDVVSIDSVDQRELANPDLLLSRGETIADAHRRLKRSAW